MVTGGLTPQDVLDPDTEIAFPESVVSLFHGDLGQPYGGFPAALQRKVLKDRKPITVRPGAILAPIDLQAAREQAEEKRGREISDAQFASYLMYPKVFLDYIAGYIAYGNVSALPTQVFFYGMEVGQEIAVDIERGKTLIIRFVALSEPNEDGTRAAFFELNGQPRSVKVTDRGRVAVKPPRRQAESGNVNHVGAPMPGTVATVAVIAGERVVRGDVLVTIEAMKMETSLRADRDATVGEIVTKPGELVDAKDLLLVLA